VDRAWGEAKDHVEVSCPLNSGKSLCKRA
jgi:hypothetical protein